MGMKLVYTNESNGNEIYAIDTSISPVRSSSTEQDVDVIDKIKPLKFLFENGEISEKEYVDRLIKLIDEIE